MQIHELNTFAGTPGAGDFLAIDDGSETFKVPMNEMNALVVTFSSFNSLPQTKSNSAIKSDMVVVGYELGTPSAQNGTWTVTTYDGSLQVSGSMTSGSSTTLKLYLLHSR